MCGWQVLVRELNKLRDQFGYEVNIVSMERVTRAEQIALAARTTVSNLSFYHPSYRR